MNDAVARMLCDLTAGMRFPGSLNLDLNEISTTLVPFPRMHFLSTALAPLRGVPVGPRADAVGHGLDAVVAEALTKSNALIRGSLRHGLHLACGVLLRGRSLAVSDVVASVQRLHGDIPLAAWNPDGFKVAMCGARSLYCEPGSPAALLASNNCGITAPLGVLYQRFLSLYRVRAHLHHYLDLVDGGAFQEAAVAVDGVVKEYAEVARAERGDAGGRGGAGWARDTDGEEDEDQ